MHDSVYEVWACTVNDAALRVRIYSPLQGDGLTQPPAATLARTRRSDDSAHSSASTSQLVC